jgi:hypothetical protein
MTNPLVGKYFIGVHNQTMRSGIVEATLADRHYLVRFDTLIGFTDGSHWPESLAVVAIDGMVRIETKTFRLRGPSSMISIGDAHTTRGSKNHRPIGSLASDLSARRETSRTAV